MVILTTSFSYFYGSLLLIFIVSRHCKIFMQICSFNINWLRSQITENIKMSMQNTKRNQRKLCNQTKQFFYLIRVSNKETHTKYSSRHCAINWVNKWDTIWETAKFILMMTPRARKSYTFIVSHRIAKLMK